MKTQCKTVFKSIFFTPFLFNISNQIRKLALPDQFPQKLAEYSVSSDNFCAPHGFHLSYKFIEIYADTRHTIGNYAETGFRKTQYFPLRYRGMNKFYISIN